MGKIIGLTFIEEAKEAEEIKEKDLKEKPRKTKNNGE